MVYLIGPLSNRDRSNLASTFAVCHTLVVVILLVCGTGQGGNMVTLSIMIHQHMMLSRSGVAVVLVAAAVMQTWLRETTA